MATLIGTGSCGDFKLTLIVRHKQLESFLGEGMTFLITSFK